MKRKILYGFLSVLIAFSIWAYVVTVVSPESENTFYNIPVVMINEDALKEKGLMVTSESQPTVNLQLRGNRSDLNNLKHSDITVVADLSKINAAGEQLLSCDISFAGAANAFEILNQTPNQVTLTIAEWMTKEVPVNLRYSGSLGLDYIAYKDEATVYDDSVTLSGPRKVVDRITQAVVDINLDGKNETINESFRYTLCDGNGSPVDAASVTTNTAEVAVTVRIERVKEIQLLLNVLYGAGATADNTAVVLEQETIKVSGSDKVLDGLDSLVIGTVNLEEILQNTTLSFPVTLPDGVENLSGITQMEANVIFTGLASKTLTVTKFFTTGLPSGMRFEIGTKKVEVTVRGPEALVEEITAENVSLLISLSGAERGEDLYKAQVMIDTRYEDAGVGAFGSYTVLVTLTEKTEVTQ